MKFFFHIIFTQVLVTIALDKTEYIGKVNILLSDTSHLYFMYKNCVYVVIDKLNAL